jgi:septation ring formation regulator EzrA
MAGYSRNASVQQQRALSSAEATLSRIQKHAEAVQDERITASEAVEQILDELAARPVLGRVREALGQAAEPSRPH